MKREELDLSRLAALLLAIALVATAAHPGSMASTVAVPIAANEVEAQKGAGSANTVAKQKRKALAQACTAPSKSPFPCRQRR